MMAPVLSSIMVVIVVDTNILVSALLSGGGASRQVLRGCLRRHYQPLVGAALFSEYEDVFGRTELFAAGALSEQERMEVFEGFLSVCRWTEVFYAWRPNLPDEADNHLVELAIAGNATAIVTRNVRDLAGGELRFPQLRVLTPQQCLKEFPCPR